jgi:hypothetical protein
MRAAIGRRFPIGLSDAYLCFNLEKKIGVGPGPTTVSRLRSGPV